MNDSFTSLANSPAAAPVTVHDEELLAWLVCILFTDKFLIRNANIMYSYPPYDTDKKKFYEEVVEWVNGNVEAKKLLEEIRSIAILDEGEEEPENPDLIKTNTISFINYVNGRVKIPENVIKAVEPLFVSAFYRQEAIDREKREFPILSKEEFQQLIKEPLWSLTQAILYVSGVKSEQKKAQVISYIKSKPELMKLCKYINAAKKIKTLDYFLARSESDEEALAKHPDFHDISHGEVKPEQFVAWAKTMPVSLAMFEEEQPQEPEIKSNSAEKPRYVTPDMQLMFDAIERHWGHYDLANPNRHTAPRKDEVVKWLKEEAARRNHKISDNIAKAIDTIIRCPEAKSGGNSY